MGLIEELAQKAVNCMLAQVPITVMHPAGWQRDGFPLPIKRVDPSPDGSTTQCYRPIAVLEWVDEKMAAAAKTVSVKPADDVDDLFGV